MSSLRFAFLIVGISMILSSTVFGGESPNEDRIGNILSLITSGGFSSSEALGLEPFARPNHQPICRQGGIHV